MQATTYAPQLFSLLGNDMRWKLVSALVRGDFSVNELQQRVRGKQNLVSYHLGRLRKAKLVTETASIADGRETYYSLNMANLQRLFFSSGESLHPALTPNPESTAPGTDQKLRVLFLCTHNSARSQIAEGLLRAKGGEGVEVFSAGTEPSTVNPLAIEAMDGLGIDIRSQQSKSMEGFLGQHFDYVITVCDRAKDSCPVFPGAPEQIHWSFPDPSEAKGSREEQLKAFEDTAQGLMQRINYFLLMVNR
ncbi:MAG: helix-turn-helix domain-containing protein [Anaerolineales bacterium]|nr:helix-turn-helix domain-containing protein [Anaerolineales bacterium]